MTTSHPAQFLAVAGTRPEVIKLAPVLMAFAERSAEAKAALGVTGQHRNLIDAALNLFGLTPAFDLNLMRPGQSPAEFMGRALVDLTTILQHHQPRPAALIVQGDTTTATAAAWTGFLSRLPVAHVEAGLRTRDRRQPFPEEINRRTIGLLADWHFAPTPRARDHLLAEGVASERILVVGNTVVDALRWLQQRLTEADLPASARRVLDAGYRLVLVTAHRREAFGTPLRNVLLALRDLVMSFENVRILFPVHPNPAVREATREHLAGVEQIQCVEPLNYRQFIAAMSRADLIVTDSGGVQEEASSLGVPTLVTRDQTERPEGVEVGLVRLVGTERRRIVAEAAALLGDSTRQTRPDRPLNLYGDGQAGRRIVAALLGDANPPPPFVPSIIPTNSSDECRYESTQDRCGFQWSGPRHSRH